MKAAYDGEADALMIELGDQPEKGYAEDVGDGAACWVGVDDDDRRVYVELLGVAENFKLLDAAAEQYDLDARALKVAAAAAIAAPFHFVDVKVGEEMPA
ncbi:MAG: hypothetical protein JSS97_11860 [Actinobacteria bacterium]|nr:hypothetical protein [Actinomycetota bacterium]